MKFAIRGVMVNGTWESNPGMVKREFFSYFLEKSKPFVRERPRMLFAFSKILLADQKKDLEGMFFRKEIKKAVWDCGNEKSSGPNGFTFDFFKKYWEIIENDLVDAINQFHKIGKILRGCHSYFITLIPKLLANRIALVVEDIVSLEQSAFVKGRKIMDGPMILNKILNWCKKVGKTMVFKLISRRLGVSLRGDGKKLRFGNKWCSWIRGCLESSMASVLVNFMERLHMVIEKAMSVGHLQRIYIGMDNIVVSHLLYADDAIFLGEWNNTNINNIVSLLRCFFLALGLKINLNKCKLMGVDVSTTKVQKMAKTIGCEAATLPFVYLGVPVRENMTRDKIWKDVIDKFKSRLSK
ncbi:hypothetical protein Tco_0411775 [Tanacetum coccineum]